MAERDRPAIGVHMRRIIRQAERPRGRQRWLAKASFSSITLMSPILSPSRSSSFREDRAGP